ncbi:D-ribose transporter subunit; membrane component of ABC superfamily [Bradyrhizobium sp. STM 3843]|uniref:ABC transporter permease n=1 Tax=Bradyrhizobium sp. STM 3843 TaxID=551947 RepID=UPI000240ADEF|nr:ABC transporter permease [Bradyrhizobium sp. STM 3843]CCE05176.1 D-ribose transporter subunit; membrane component of ABC superfamily [Bradyrhizobium sp. STM 3843]
MKLSAIQATEETHAAISDIVNIREQSALHRVMTSQAFWVAAALFALVVFMTWLEPTFGTADNVTNITRNFAPLAIMSLGMTVVIITGGIDLSVGSVMGLVAIVTGLLLTWHHSWYVAFAAGLLAGLACGAFNGFFVAYIGMPSFVVTLGMLSIARSLAVVLSGNQMLYQFGPDAPIVRAIGQAKWPLHPPTGWAPRWMPEFSSHFWVMVILALILGAIFIFTAWARHLYAIGSNENAARLTGVSVDWIKFQAYVFSALTASIASLLLLGYSGSAINAMGTGYELRVIAGTVIGGANLMGGYGTAFGAVIGSAFLEVIRNALLMAGIDSNWQGAFVGMFIVIAVLLGMQTSGTSLVATIREWIVWKRV